MFTRNSASGFMRPEPPKPGRSAGPNESPAARPPSLEAGKSVISNDLKIIGRSLRIISRGTLEVDGEVEGDVGGAEIIIGEQGRVTGTVAAERVIVRGRISGAIRAMMTVALQSSARVEGDIHHVACDRAGRRVRRALPAARLCLGAPARFGRLRLDAKRSSARPCNRGCRGERAKPR